VGARAHLRVVAALLAVLVVAALAQGRSHPARAPAAARAAPAAALAAPDPAFAGRLAGVPLQRARCRNWHAAGAGERLGAIRALRETVGGASTTGGVGTTLADEQATALFDRICATPQTSGFALYLLYARAAAFSGRLDTR
jgi:hypothetical protein